MMDVSSRRLIFVALLLNSAGCFQPWSLRLPTFMTGPPDFERAAYQYHDPFPDSQMGPNTGVRPLSFNEQRPLPVRIREKYDGSRWRETGATAVPPPVSPPAGSQYPQVVPF